MNTDQAAMGAIARAERFINAVGTDDPNLILSWGEAKGALQQLLGDLRHEQAEHEQTRNLLRDVERSGDRAAHRADSLVSVLRSAFSALRHVEDWQWGKRESGLRDDQLLSAETVRPMVARAIAEIKTALEAPDTPPPQAVDARQAGLGGRK